MFRRKKSSLCFIIMLLVVISLPLTVYGCQSSNTTTSSGAASTPAKTIQSASTEANATATGSPATKPVATQAAASHLSASSSAAASKLAELLSKSSNITMKYETVSSMTVLGSPQEFVTQYWIKGLKQKTVTDMAGTQSISVVDFAAGVSYLYMPSLNRAYKTDIGQAGALSAQAGGALEPGDLEGIMQYSPLEAGIETIDGKICTIIVYSYPETGNIKMWVWQDKGLPLKMEQDSPLGKLTVIYRNYDFGDIAESEFELPQCVIFTEMEPTGVPKLP